MQPTNIINGVWRQGTEPKVRNLTGTAFMEEAGAHIFHVSGEDETGAALAFTGTVSALFLRADDTYIAIDGTLNNGAAEVTLVSDCYHVPGRFSIAVYISDGTVSSCVYAAVGNVYRTTSDAGLDSGASIPTLAQLQAAYQACVEATEDAGAVLNSSVRYDTAQTLTTAEKAQARANIVAQERIEPDGAVTVDMSGLAAVYITGDVGQKISYKSSPASVSYKRAAWVQAGCAYVLSATSGSLGSANARICAITDTSDIILQKLEFVLVENGTAELTFTAEADGLLCVCVDNNTTEVTLHGGPGYGIVRYETVQNLTDAQKEQARENIGAASKADVDVIARGHGENLIDLADLSAVGTNVAATVETDEQENRWLSVATTASQAWATVATPSGWVANNLTVGRTYRLHAKVEKVSGSLYLIVGFRGVQGNTGGYASSIRFVDNTVGGEGFVDFELTQYVQTITIMLTNGTRANAAIKVTDLWLTDVTDEAVIYSGHLNLTEGQQETARRNINTPLTPEAGLIGRIATLYTDYAALNYRKVSVAGNHVSITKTSSSGSTFHGKSILGSTYSTELDSGAISTTAARANRFREMYTAGAYAPLEGSIPLYNENGTQYKLRMSYWTNGVGSSVQRHGLYLGTYNPDTDSVAEFGFYDVQSQTVDGSTVYILPALRELSITTDFLEAVNANKNLMALLIVRSGGDSGNVCHFVWDIVPDSSHYVTTVSGATPTITAVENVRYECGTVTELDFTPSTSGLCEVVFASGSTATVLTLPETVRMPDWWTGVEANRTYDLMILNGTLAGVMSWAT